MPSTSHEHLDDKPWHRQFWPWFLIGLVSSAVLASLITLVIAIRNPDPLVERDPALLSDAPRVTVPGIRSG